jgi:3',5'-cyclic AMP phosphodiesterase CpdA
VIRLAHLSDVHITADRLGWGRLDWFNKRLTGWLNYRLSGRGQSFRQADLVLAALIADVQERRPDHVVFSGDATGLGFEAEFARAAALLKVADPHMPPGLAVPGNHDYYTRASAASGLFERYFAPWQTGVRVDAAVYPFAQRVGPVWVVGVNSCTGNRWPWDAGGSVDGPQLGRLGRLLQGLEPGPRVLVTHYPVRLASGQPERRGHGLRNLPDLVRVAARGGVVLWLHGHRHASYHLPHGDDAPFPAICVGSSTQHGHWSYKEYAIEGDRLVAARRVYAPEAGRFQEATTFEVKLPLGLERVV